MACVLTHMPAPSGKLGSAQRRTASSSDSGNTNGSSSLDTAPAAAPAAPDPAAARCWFDSTPAQQTQAVGQHPLKINSQRDCGYLLLLLRLQPGCKAPSASDHEHTNTAAPPHTCACC